MKLSRALIGGAVAAALVTGGIIWAVSDSAPLVLDHTWGSPTVIGGIASGASTVDLLVDGVADAGEKIELGSREYFTSTLTTAALSVDDPQLDLAGAVPGWVPVVDGAVTISLVTGAQPTEGAPTESTSTDYYVRMASLVATDRTTTEVLEAIKESAQDWSYVRDAYTSDDSELTFVADDRPDPEGDRPDSASYLDVSVQQQESIPGLVVVEVTAGYTIQGPARMTPKLTGGTLVDLQTYAASQDWTLAGWDVSGGVGGVPNGSVNWTGSSSTSLVATTDAITDQLGLPRDGDATDTDTRGWLQYDDGNVELTKKGSSTTITWRPDPASLNGVDSETAEAEPFDLGEPGVPFRTVDLGSRGPVDVGRGTPTTEQDIASFDQLGMIAIDNATATVVTSGHEQKLPGVTRRAEMWVLLDTDWTLDDVAAGLEGELEESGLQTELKPTTDSYGFDGPSVELTAGQPYGEPTGRPWYRIEVGNPQEHPGLVEVRIEVGVDLAGDLQPSPAGWDEYFKAPKTVASEQKWTLTRWYLVEGTATNGGILARGELDWTTPDRGPDGLENVADVLGEVSGVEPTGDGFFWFEGEDDWATSLGVNDGRYTPIEVSWEGRSLDPTST